MDNVGGRKRAALWTIGRGSRGLVRFSHEGVEYVIAGTTIAAGNNNVHIIRADPEDHDFKPVSVYATDAEVWSMELVSVDESTVFVIAGTRRKRRSAAEIWSMSLLNAPETMSAKGSPRSNTDDVVRAIDVKCSVDLEGYAIKVSRSALDRHLYLSVTNSSAAILKVDMILEPSLSSSLEIDPSKDGTEKGAIVDGGWITDNQCFIAYEGDVRIYDTTTGRLCAVVNPSDLITKQSKKKEREGTAPFFSKITSACVCSTKHSLYVGCQDGSLQGFDISSLWSSPDLPEEKRDYTGWVAQATWKIAKGHNQWVSVLSAMPNGGVLSGDIDGLVRCWTKDGSPAGTFPQHVDTVTGATVSSKSFVTISYDGRIALNQVPLVT